MATKKRARKPDNSPYVHQSKKKNVNFGLDCRIPWTDKQFELIDLIHDKSTKLIFLSGPAGTSKTLVSVFTGLQMLKDKKVSDIIYLRSVVESSSNKMGFLPGGMDEKFDPYMEPLLDKVDELVSKEDQRLLLDNQLISSRPINYLRGTQFAGKFVILDEGQNLSKKELTTFSTRIGEFSKVIIAGDPMQSDIGAASGFKLLFDIFNDQESRDNGIKTFEFSEEDIVRSELVKFIVKKIQEE